MVKRKYISPLKFIFYYWVAAILFINYGPILYYDLSGPFYYSLVIILIMYCIGYFSTYILPIQTLDSLMVSRFFYAKKIKIIMFSMVILLILFLIVNVYYVTGTFFNLELYRSLMTDGGQSGKLDQIIPLLNPFAFVMIIYLLIIKAKARVIIFAILLLLIYSVLTTGRASLLVILLMVFWYIYLTKGIKLKYIILSASVFIVFFASVGFMLGKLNLDLEYFFRYVASWVPQNIISLALVNIGTYATSGIVAFSEFQKSNQPLYEPYLTLANFYKIFFFLDKPTYGILENIGVPFKTNVYSWLFVPYKDFGNIGLAVVFLIYGFISGITYRVFLLTKSINSTIFLSLIYTILSLSIFHDYVFSSLFPYTIIATVILLNKIYSYKVRIN